MRCWFSARIRALVLVEGLGTVNGYDSIFVFRMDNDDPDVAKHRAIAIAREKLERSFVNMDGGRTRWCVSRVLTLDVLRTEDLDAVEVWQEGITPSVLEQFAFDAEFDPMAEPTDNSGVDPLRLGDDEPTPETK